MEQHPVPRNITGFQFHLIGDMTLRQFSYLSAGIGIGYLIYRVSPFPGFITLMFAGCCALVGFAFAFLPIQERPLDKWLAAFLKSILSPTRFTWQKNNLPPVILMHPATAQVKVISPVHYQAQKDAREKLRTYLATLPTPPHETLNREEKSYIDKTLAMFGSTPPVSTPLENINRSTSTVNVVVKPPFQEPTRINPPIPTTLESIAPAPTVLPADKITIAHQGISLQVKPVAFSDAPSLTVKEEGGLANQLQKIIKEKEMLEQQLQKLKTELNQEYKPEIVNPQINPEEKKGPTVYTINPQEVKTEIGIPVLPQTPNILSGVVKDPQKKILPNVIITIKDKSNMPIRALKTNKLGQFATATPLPNGTYLICPEDPLKRYVFDIAQITLSGKVFMPIEIIAKGEKELMREQLTKQIFGNDRI